MPSFAVLIYGEKIYILQDRDLLRGHSSYEFDSAYPLCLIEVCVAIEFCNNIQQQQQQQQQQCN
ncbi:MAG: hypothetical protein ACI90V_007344 [Bacillariaceae sp.]|jgi:hypothetical protein